MMLLVLALSACGGGETTPTREIDQPEAPTKTPTPTLAPTATATPAPAVYDDETDDALNCQICEPATGQSLRPVMDITSAQVERQMRDGECYFVFEIEFGRVEAFEEMFIGGVEFLDPESMVLVDFNWCFNSAAQWSFNFTVMPGQPLTTYYAYVGDAAQWVPGEDTRYSGSVEGNVVTLNVPCDLVEEDWLWMVACTDGNMWFCDELGMGADRAASLPLP
jgi:hypothetical protein